MIVRRVDIMEEFDELWGRACKTNVSSVRVPLPPGRGGVPAATFHDIVLYRMRRRATIISLAEQHEDEYRTQE